MQSNVLDFVAKLFQPSVKSWLDTFLSGQSQGPFVIEFDPTTACNMTCPECISGTLLNQGQIDLARTLALIDEFKRIGVRGVIFIGGGEPLAHKGMPLPIRRCHNNGMSVGLTTNGTLIGRYLDDLAECVAWTRVSIDAGSQEMFSRFRPSRIKDSFRVVTDNMAMLAKRKSGLLGYSFLVMERHERNGATLSNVGEIAQAARIAREIGCDYFEVKPAVDMHHNLVPFSDDVQSRMREQMHRMEGLATNSFRILAPDSISHLLEADSHHQPKDYTACPSLEVRTVVTPKGVYACPYKRGISEGKLGEISNIPFGAYWHSDERKARSRTINPSTDCPFFCVRHEFNRTLLALAQARTGGVDLLPYMTSIERNDVFI